MNEWIRVDDRLPRDGEEIVIRTKDMNFKHLISKICRKKNVLNASYLWVSCIGGYQATLEPYSVTHWMPLLEPPGE